MKIAITGGSGFLGKATAYEAVHAGHTVWTFDRADGCDVLGPLSGLKGADAVIHLAGVLGTAELFDTPEVAVDVNIKGSLRILQWCRENDAAYVGITMPDAFPSVYTATKIAAQRLATAWHEAYGVPVSHVRAFNAYGPGQAHGLGHPQKILPTFSVEAWNGRPIPVWGDGTQTVDLVHSYDVARMLVSACTAGGDDAVFDAGTGVAVTVNELARVVLDVTGSIAGIEHLPMRTGEKPTEIVAAGEGWDRLDWKPSMDWPKITKTINWYKP
jgi:UDP-glucose 4-epimerase